MGKSSVATQYAVAAAARGEHAVIYTFDETLETYFLRSAALGPTSGAYVEAGQIEVHQVDPAEMSQGEFAHGLRQVVEESQARVVVLDSLNGYLHVLPDKDLLPIQMHELLTTSISGGFSRCWSSPSTGWSVTAWESPTDISYLADTVLYLTTSRWPERCAGRFPQSSDARGTTMHNPGTPPGGRANRDRRRPAPIPGGARRDAPVRRHESEFARRGEQ